MWRSREQSFLAAVMLFSGGFAALAQSPASPPAPALSETPAAQGSSQPTGAVTDSAAPVASEPSAAVNGGSVHGQVKSGNTPLPGVTISAQNTLTGKKYSTITDVTGGWLLALPQNGRYVIRTRFPSFAQTTQETVLNAANRDQTVNFDLMLASRAAQAAQQNRESVRQSAQTVSGTRQSARSGAQDLSLTSALSADTETQEGSAATSETGGSSLPSIASSSDFSGESVEISGQAGTVSALAGVDVDRLRDALAQGQGGGAATGGLFGGGGFGGGGLGGGGFRSGGGLGAGGRGNFRNFNSAQPHGAIAWNGNTSIFNAQPFALLGQSQAQPTNGSNKFTITFMSAPYIPHLTKPSGKDSVYLTLSGTRQSTPDDYYATVPTAAERVGDFSASGLPPIYNPVTGQQFAANGNPNITNGTANVIPAAGALYQSISPQATALLAYLPAPNLASGGAINGYNYHLLTTGQSNTTNAGVRYMRSFGANATQSSGRGGLGGGGRRSSQNQGLRQSVNFNYNWAHSASDLVNLIPALGGKSASSSYSLQAGYTVGYHRVTSILNANWNRSNSHTTNFFTNTADNPIADEGISIPNEVPLNYGLPGISLSNGIQGLSETQPSFSISQTISFSEVLSWIHGKHNLRFGSDYRRVHRDFLAGSNATGNFAFTGLFTEQFETTPNGLQPAAGTGSSIADFLLGLPQSTSLNSSLAKSYLRDNVYDAYAQDDWRALASLTLNYGVRWEFYAPYTEKYGHLAEVLTNPSEGFTSEAEVVSGASGLPASLVYPWYKAFAPRVGLAWRVPKVKSTVVRSGFGINYTVGEYATFASVMAHQPMIVNGQAFNNEQTNQEAVGNTPSTACALTNTCFTLGDGFTSTGQTVGSYALNPHYGLPYVMAWNLDMQKTLPWGIVMNLGYNGSRSNHLDVKLAPRALPGSPGTDPANAGSNNLPPSFTYDEAEGFYKMNQATVRVNKRLQKGVSMGANYQYGHAIDDASSVNGSSGSVVQNWQDVAAQEGHSGLDIRHQVSGTYLFELPFGPEKYWVTSGVSSHLLEGFSISGSFSFATGSWISPGFEPTSQSVECGNAGALRPNLVPGQPVTAGGHSQLKWFNTAAYAAPANTPGYCNYFGSAPRNSIEGPGTVSNNMALSKTAQFGSTRSLEIRATINNVFNTVQFSGVDTMFGDPKFGEITSAASMRSFQFSARLRY